MKIRNMEDAREAFRQSDRSVIGIATSAFSRLGPERYCPNYAIASLKDGDEVGLIGKDVNVLVSGQGGRHVKGGMLRDRRVIEFISSFGEPCILPYRVTKKVIRIAGENGWKIIGNTMPLKISDKAEFREILKSLKIDSVPGETSAIQKHDYSYYEKKYGKFVMQIPKSSGGKGTFFVNSAKDFEEAVRKIKEKTNKMVVTKFIEGPSPSITGCVTKHGVVCTNLQHQLLDLRECVNPANGTGIFCGHDWSSSSFDAASESRAHEYAEKIGNCLKSAGYVGIFGIDMIMDGGSIYPLECNPRLLGSYPVLDMVQVLLDLKM